MNSPNHLSAPAWVLPPPICQALLPIEEVKGQRNINDVWTGEVLELEGPNEGEIYRCIFKRLDHAHHLPVELACALSATLLGNHVPQPCLVRVTSDELPGNPKKSPLEPEILLFGCSYIDQDAFFEQLASLDSDAALNGAVWESFCGDALNASKGAALDELIVNFDRHPRNLRYDGTHWWLIDHDMSLLETQGKDIGKISALLKPKDNEIADELLKRYPHNHNMQEAAKLGVKKQKEMQILAAKALLWEHPDPLVHDLWHKTALLLDLLARRTPMLESLIGARIGVTKQTSLQWIPPTL